MAQNFFLKEPAPTKVQVVNDLENPTKTQVINFPTTAGGSIQVFTQGGTLNSLSAFRPASSANVNVFLENILLLQGDGTFVPIPLCSFLTNVTTTQVNNCLASYKSAYSTLVSGVTAATLHYSKMTQSGVVTSEVYDLKAND